MKKSITAIIALSLFVLGGNIWAQDRSPVRIEQTGYAETTATISGVLRIRHGEISLVAGSFVYYVPILEVFLNFIEGLEDGVEITMEGHNGERLRFEPTKLTIRDKTYEFPSRTVLVMNGLSR